MLICEEVHKVYTSQNTAQPAQSNEGAESSNNDDGKKTNKRKRFFDFIETESEIQTESKHEVTQYLSDEDGLKHKSALLFWKEKIANYKALSKVAKKFLDVPATSGFVKRAFSQAGRILRADRCKILPKNFEQLVFLKVNNAYNFEEI